jgi:hypothetical protein
LPVPAVSPDDQPHGHSAAPGEAGMAIQKIIDGVYRSAKAGKEVPIA